jgi:hypothetical protein
MALVLNPQTDRQRRTRNVAGALAAYGAGALAKGIFGGPKYKSSSAESRLTQRVMASVHEMKNLDSASIGGSISTTAYTQVLLNSVNQGTGGNNRTGRLIEAKQVLINLELQGPGGTTPDHTVRVLVWTDLECRGSAAGMSDVLQDNTFGWRQLLVPRNFDNTSRFVIHHDELVNLSPTINNSSSTSWNTPHFTRKMVLPLNRVVHYYNTTGGSIADIDSGSLYITLIQSDGTVSVTYNIEARLLFRDK